MASLRKTLGTNLDATSDHTFEVERTFNFRNFTVEAKMSSINFLAYPEGENDAELALLDDETDTDNYNVINGGLVKAAGGTPQAKLRVVDLNTQNVTVKWTANSAEAGVIEELNITFQK